MKKDISRLLYACLALMGLLSSCGEDRSGEYYALIATKTWIYEVMQENYLFYEDIPAEEKLNFFKKPAEFLASAASSKDQKKRLCIFTRRFCTHTCNQHIPLLWIRGGIGTNRWRFQCLEGLIY